MTDRSKSIPRVFAAWEQGTKARAGHCWTDGVKVYTYGVPLVERIEGQDKAVLFNTETYSSTSSAHRNAIRAELERAGYEVREVAGPGRWDTDMRLAGRVLTLLALLLSAACGTPEPAQLAEQQPAADTCTVTHVTDGDTIRCGETRIRLLGIDAPERGQDGGASATAALRRMLPEGSAATLRYDVQERDRYGRVLAYVYAADGVHVNEALVRGGYALRLTYAPNVLHAEAFGVAQDDARERRAGLWALDAFECTPKQYRARECGR